MTKMNYSEFSDQLAKLIRDLKKRKIAAFVFLGLVILYFLFPTAVSIEMGNKVVNDGANNGLMVGGDFNYNAQAEFLWLNPHRDLWRIKRSDQGYASFLDFRAEGSLVPGQACLYLNSDVNIKNVDIEGIQHERTQSGYPSKKYFFCTGGISSDPRFWLISDQEPHELSAELVRNSGLIPERSDYLAEITNSGKDN